MRHEDVVRKDELVTHLPITLLWEKVLMLPVVGIVDSTRSQQMMEMSLKEIQAHDARIMILDILGVHAVDSAVANHLIKITQAARLMGCDCVISGMSPAVAQSIVQLAIPLGEIVTRVTLRDALAHAFDKLGLTVTAKSSERSIPAVARGKSAVPAAA